MRLNADMRPPGVYPAMAERIVTALAIADTRIAGFVGMTLKGPIDEPQRINNWDEFVEIYGVSDEHYLTESVHAFFRNGGGTCFVVRTAHIPRAAPGEPVAERGLDHAACAELIHNDDWKKPSLRVLSLNEGRWGNNTWMRCSHSAGAQALLTRDLDIGAGEAHVNSVRGFEVGALVRIYDRESSDHVVLTEIGDKLIKWGSDTPVNRRHRAAAPTQLQVIAFDLHVALSDRREVFKGLQMDPRSRNYAPRVVAQRSRLIRLEDLKTRSPVPHNLPEPHPQAQRLAGGRDGTETITPEDFLGFDHGPASRGGLLGLGAIDEVGLLAIPDAMVFCEREKGPAGELRAQRIQEAMVSICENQRDRFAILDIPQTRDVESVRAWRRRTDSSYAAFYWPWLKMETAGGPRVVPPSGVMAGIFAKKDTEGGVHHVPANVEIVGAADLGLRLTEDHLGLLNADGVNGFRFQRGVRPWGGRTASSDPDWRYINIRRIFIMLRRSLDSGMQWVTFEPNDATTWNLVRGRVTEFLGRLFQMGMFAGGKPEEAFFVKCDAETNPADEVDKGKLICEIGVAPVSPAEFVIISMIQDMGATPAG